MHLGVGLARPAAAKIKGKNPSVGDSTLTIGFCRFCCQSCYIFWWGSQPWPAVLARCCIGAAASTNAARRGRGDTHAGGGVFASFGKVGKCGSKARGWRTGVGLSSETVGRAE